MLTDLLGLLLFVGLVAIVLVQLGLPLGDLSVQILFVHADCARLLVHKPFQTLLISLSPPEYLVGDLLVILLEIFSRWLTHLVKTYFLFFSYKKIS